MCITLALFVLHCSGAVVVGITYWHILAHLHLGTFDKGDSTLDKAVCLQWLGNTMDNLEILPNNLPSPPAPHSLIPSSTPLLVSSSNLARRHNGNTAYSSTHPVLTETRPRAGANA